MLLLYIFLAHVFFIESGSDEDDESLGESSSIDFTSSDEGGGG